MSLRIKAIACVGRLASTATWTEVLPTGGTQIWGRGRVAGFLSSIVHVGSYGQRSLQRNA